MPGSTAIRVIAEEPCKPEMALSSLFREADFGRTSDHHNHLPVSIGNLLLAVLEARPCFVPIAACAVWPGRREHDLGNVPHLSWLLSLVSCGQIAESLVDDAPFSLALKGS